MSRFKGFAARVRSVLLPASAERRMEEEFAFHVEMETERLRKTGLALTEARRQARATFGGGDAHREEMRDGRPARWFQDVRADVRYGWTMLRKHKGLTAIAIVSLAVGIGANSAIFSIVNALLFRPRAVSRPEELVQVYAGDRQVPYQTISYPSYLDFRDRSEVFTGLAAYGIGYQFKLTSPDDVELVWGEPVSGNYFDVLGVPAYRGRTFAPDEDQVPGRNPVVVISHSLWQRRFAADPAIIGRTITINNHPLTVIGVAPPQYTGMMSGWATEIWVPVLMMPLLEPSNAEGVLTRSSKWLTLVGRLKPDATFEQARARFAVLTKSMQAEHPDEWLDRREDGVRENVVSVLPERATRPHPALRVPAYGVAALLFGVVNLVLVIACMNLAGMLFARGVARRNEIAVRLALGARRSRIVRQLLTESLLLSLLAGVTGILLAFWALNALMASLPALPEGIRLAIDVPLDWRVMLYTILFATITGLLFGLAPALHSSRSAVSAVLKDDASAFAGPSRTSRVRRWLVVAQLAFSVLLLIGAGLMLRSLENVRPTRLGFASDNVVVAPVTLDETLYTRERSLRFYEELSAAVAALPGVRAVSLVDGMPGGFMSRTRRGIEIDGYTARADEDMQIDASIVGPRYFTNMGVPIVLGRDFDSRDRDGSPCVAIINEAFAQRYLAGSAAALGKHVVRRAGARYEQRVMCEIVGVIRDNAWQSLQREVRPFFAMPVLQSDQRKMTLLASVAVDPASLVTGVRRVIQAMDPSVVVTDVQTLDEHFAGTVYPFRLLGLVIAGCGVLALILAMIGVYGTVAYSVAQRRREVGIRMALGAVRTDILRLVVGQGMVLVGYGLGLGLILGAILSRVLTMLPLDTTLLFGVSATDAVTFGGVAILLAVVALAACYLPARRATRVDPVVTLRSS